MTRAPIDKEPPPLDDSALRRFLGYNLKRAHLIVQGDFLAKLADYEMRAPVFSTLLLIVENPGASQTSIANALAVERSAMVLLIDELERRGLVVRKKSLNDRRSYALHATSEGVRLCRQMVTDVVRHEDALLHNLSQEQRDLLVQLLQQIHR